MSLSFPSASYSFPCYVPFLSTLHFFFLIFLWSLLKVPILHLFHISFTYYVPFLSFHSYSLLCFFRLLFLFLSSFHLCATFLSLLPSILPFPVMSLPFPSAPIPFLVASFSFSTLFFFTSFHICSTFPSSPPSILPFLIMPPPFPSAPIPLLHFPLLSFCFLGSNPARGSQCSSPVVHLSFMAGR